MKKYDNEEIVTNRYCKQCGRDYESQLFQFIDLCNACYDTLYPPHGLEYLRQYWREQIIPKFPRKDGETDVQWVTRISEDGKKRKPFKRRRVSVSR